MQGHKHNRQRRLRIQQSLYEITFGLEFILAILVIGLVAMEIGALILMIKDHLLDPTITIEYSYFLQQAMDIVLSIEFLKMLCRHNLDSVIEVISFAMARHMIVHATTMTEGFICAAGIAILFIVRKYLFIEKIDKVPELDEGMAAPKDNPHNT